MINLQVNNEVGKLRKVILGNAIDRGNKRYINNPRYKHFFDTGKDPLDIDLLIEIDQLKKILYDYEVEVFNLKNIPDTSQIFCRDIAFVIGDNFFVSSMQKKNRRIELLGLEEIISGIGKVHYVPEGSFIEGGDVIVHNNYVFIGVGGRTNSKGVDFVRDIVGDKKEIIELDIFTSNNPMQNVLHLDTAFQPVGKMNCIVSLNGFKRTPEPIFDVFGVENIISISDSEMYEMNSNVLSIDHETVIVEKKFTRLISELSRIDIKTIAIDYSNVSKLGGLFRCSTCPIYREEII